ncbi:MAG: alcohol dehydrogenase catalytic domain-containing protein [Candidatus Aminicenantales bacterium]
MKAAVLTGLRRVEIREVPHPLLKSDTDVLIRVGAIGLCGSDIHYYAEGRIGDQVVEYPFIVGHECAGTVLKTAPSVRDLKPGDRVAVDPAVVCGVCDQCLAGRPNTCRRLLYLGTPGQASGALCEFIVMPEQNCHPLPEGLSLEEGVLVEPMSIALHGMRMAGEPAPKTVAVLGAGPIGLSVVLAARAAGVQTIYVTDKIEERVQASRKAGAAWAGNPDREDIVEAIGRLSPGQVDAVFECCGDQSALNQAVALLKPGGRLLIIGIPAVDRVSFDIHSLRRKELSLHNVRRQRDCIRDTIDLIRNKQVEVRFMATHTFRIEDSQKAFELAAGCRDGIIRAVVHP